MSQFEPESQRPPAAERAPSSSEPAKESAREHLNPGADTQLTPEEQMAAFEKDLKENDWGHQPC